MIKTSGLWRIGLLMFSIVMLIDFAQYYLFTNEWSRKEYRCVERRLESKESTDHCPEIVDAAESAYTRATSSHVVIAFAGLMLFLTLANKLAKAENRIAELEEKLDA
jgi:hypothetical protein